MPAVALSGSLTPFFWGPDVAREFCERELDRTPTVEELGGTCDGAAIVDEVNRALLLWSAGDEELDVPLRRVLTRLMAGSWSGWNILSHRCRALVDYLVRRHGFDEAKAFRGFIDGAGDEDFYHPLIARPVDAEKDHTGVLSARREDGSLSFFATDLDPNPPFAPLRRLHRSRWWGRSPTPSSFVVRRMPWAGTHIDLAAHTIDYWSASLFGAPRRGLADRAPGFNVQDHGDRFESQLDLCGGSLVFPSRSGV
jgi:hypothetical protein